MSSASKYDRETRVLRHLADGPKPEMHFRLGLGGPSGYEAAIGGRAALYRCWQAEWVEFAPPSPGDFGRYHWQITDKGLSELNHRYGGAA